jgi:tetratricopeptide (TPR) repeat protein
MSALSCDAFLEIRGFGQQSTDQALDIIGAGIDAGDDASRIDCLNHATILLGKLLTGQVTQAQEALANYFLGNAWSAIRKIRRGGTNLAWEWEQDELEHEIVAFRRAVSSDLETVLPILRRAQIYTNLGNLMSHIGRFCEALVYYDRAISLQPDFGMAIGNKGVCLSYYARALYDRGHACVFLMRAYEMLSLALQKPLEGHAVAGFSCVRNSLRGLLVAGDRIEPMAFQEYDIGKGHDEQEYRRWCLANRLFLNPLNDLEPHSIAARDILHMPPICTKLLEGPCYQGFFNQLKQEYASARFLCFDGLRRRRHFSDKGVVLVNTLDYPSYSVQVEKVKLAFRAAYSILDKVAFFLNDYLGLRIPPHAVSFRKIWYNNQHRSKGLRKEFARLDNWPLRGLFWLSKDLYEDEPGFRECLEPEAKMIVEVRNSLEHKYFKLHEEMWQGPDSPQVPGLHDRLASSMRRRDFESKTVHLLLLARFALLYLSLAVHVEESRKSLTRGPNAKVGLLPLDIWEDDWKD